MLLLAYLCLAVLPKAESLNILQFVYGVSSSHLIFNYRLANASASQGHNVTLFTPLGSDLELRTPRLHPNVTEIRIDLSQKEFVLPSAAFDSLVWHSLNFSVMINFGKTMAEKSVLQCRYIYEENWDIIDQLRKQNFDLVVAHCYEACPHAFIYELGIPPERVVAASAGTYIPESTSYLQSIPAMPSVQPVMQTCYSDYMGFFERMANFGLLTMHYLAVSSPSSGFVMQTRMFQEAPNYDYPSLITLAERVTGIFVNGEQYLDFPRPLPYGSGYLGEFGSAEKKGEIMLSIKWNDLVEKNNKGVILLSFGTVANTSTMPERIATALLDGVKNLVDYTIIWKFEPKDLPEISNYSHIFPVSWMPQTKLLNHPRTKLFVTHGGYNSLLESVKAGKPMVLCPLFADQYANSMRAVRYKLGRMIDLKDEATDGVLVAQTIRTVLEDQVYKRNARKLAAMLADKPVSAEHLLSHRLQQIAKCRAKFIRNIPRLNFIQYFCLDVIALWIGVTLFLVYYTTKYVLGIYRNISVK